MASTTEFRTGQAVMVLDMSDEPLIGFVVSDDHESFDLEVHDRGSNIHGETLTVFHSEIRSGGLIVHRIL